MMQLTQICKHYCKINFIIRRFLPGVPLILHSGYHYLGKALNKPSSTGDILSVFSLCAYRKCSFIINLQMYRFIK